MTMVERVARAIMEIKEPFQPAPAHLAMARAAIAAMSVPDNAMVEAAYSKGSGGIRDCWINMIDTALEEK